jgi:hypothetical protein
VNTPHILYTLAEQADARLTATIAARTNGQRDRWTMTAADLVNNPEIREALREKMNADEAWLTYLRTTRADYCRVCLFQRDLSVRLTDGKCLVCESTK